MAEKESEKIQVTFRIDPAGYREMEKFQDLLGTETLATALYSAVSMLRKLYEYQNDGYQITVVKNGTTQKIELPDKSE